MIYSNKSKLDLLVKSTFRFISSNFSSDALEPGYSSLLWGGKYLTHNFLVRFNRDSNKTLVVEVEEISLDKDLEVLVYDLHRCIQAHIKSYLANKYDGSETKKILNEYFDTINTLYNKIHCWETLAELFEFLSGSISPKVLNDKEYLWASAAERIQITILHDASEILQRHLNEKRDKIKDSFSSEDLVFKLVLFSSHEIIDQIKTYLTRGNFRDSHIKFLETITKTLTDNIFDYSYGLEVAIENCSKIYAHQSNKAKRYWLKVSGNNKYFKVERELTINNEILNWIDNYILTTSPTLVLQKEHQRKYIEEIVRESQGLAELSPERINYMINVKCISLGVGDSDNRFHPSKRNSRVIIKSLKSAFKELGTVAISFDKSTVDTSNKTVCLNYDVNIYKWIHALFWMNDRFKFETIRRVHSRKT